MSSNIVVRQVYKDNVDYEFKQIREFLPYFPYVSMDTEFPGTDFKEKKENVPAHLLSTLPPASFYKVMKEKVEALNLIQVGLTLSDANGWQFVWEFNFCDFDRQKDLQAKDSISLLERQGIDFKKNREDGIDSHHFAQLFWKYVLKPFHNIKNGLKILWVTFHGPYDFGFLIKILTQEKLPENVDDFLDLVRIIFGTSVFDVKIVMRLLGLHGGLDRVAESLKLDRVAGKAHQAGSDSLLTMHVFQKLTKMWKKDRSLMCSYLEKESLMVYGLTKVNYRVL